MEFTEEELAESAALEEQDQEARRPAPKKMVKMFINPVAYKEDIAINPVDLDNAFLTQASLFAHYATQAARAVEQMDNLKLTLDVREAQLRTEHRNTFLESGVKVTESMIDSAVMVDPRYIKVRKAYNESKGVVEMLKGATEAFRQRRDMIVQIGVNNREERKGEAFVKSAEAREFGVARGLKQAVNG